MKHETTVADTINAAFSMIEEVAQEYQDKANEYELESRLWGKYQTVADELHSTVVPDTSGIALKMTVDVNHWGETTPKPLSLEKKLGNIEAVLVAAAEELINAARHLEGDVKQDYLDVAEDCHNAANVIGSLEL